MSLSFFFVDVFSQKETIPWTVSLCLLSRDHNLVTGVQTRSYFLVGIPGILDTQSLGLLNSKTLVWFSVCKSDDCLIFHNVSCVSCHMVNNTHSLQKVNPVKISPVTQVKYLVNKKSLYENSSLSNVQILSCLLQLRSQEPPRPRPKCWQEQGCQDQDGDQV